MVVTSKYKYMFVSFVVILGVIGFSTLFFDDASVVPQVSDTSEASLNTVETSVQTQKQMLPVVKIDRGTTNIHQPEQTQLIDPEQYANMPKVQIEIPDHRFIEDPLESLVRSAPDFHRELKERYGPEIFEDEDLGDLEYYFDLTDEQHKEIALNYTPNYNPYRENSDYIIRSDLFIPAYLEPVNDEAIFAPALDGYRADKMLLSIYSGLTEYDISDIAHQIQSSIGYPITVIDISEINNINNILELSYLEIIIHYPQLPTSQETEHVKKQIQNISYIQEVIFEQDILPEYWQAKYYNFQTELQFR
ncbi:hypothetical protein MK079_02335 [Candidatus Gracilibacteria bacterium]|nr:hypothetical protein [Candidatus Gracilibacteria bacterium]